MHDRKEFEVQATILTIADFLVTDKPFPSVSSVKCNNTETVWDFFSKDNFSVSRQLEFLENFS